MVENLNMNQKIKELTELARLQPYYDAQEACIDKFAELIIKECIKNGDGLINHYINTHNEQEQAFLIAAINDYQTLIKKHFGIE